MRYADNIYGYVRSIVRDDHEAEDITQQLFSKLTAALSRYEPRSVPFAAWILRVARNLALDHIRAVRAIPCEEVRPVDAVAEDYSFERSRALEDALDALPRDQRQVLILRHVVGLTPGRDRALARQDRGLHPRLAPSRPADAAARAVGVGRGPRHRAARPPAERR